jgi:protocatechuate 3,4-dioxygenase beta subunit
MFSPTAAIDEGHGHLHARPLVRPDPAAHVLTRRRLLAASAAITGAGLAGAGGLAFGQPTTLRPTSEQVTGPFYPLRLPSDQDADLSVIADRPARALGTVVVLSGRVTNRRGEPVPNAEIDIWQANAAGRYTHPGDDNPQPIDPNFDGYARLRTDAEGHYRVKTIKPGAYPVPGVAGWLRPPHIHFDVRGRESRLVTQMYFEGEELNAKDRFFERMSAGAKESVLARYGARSAPHEADALVAVWNIVLLAG